MHEKTYFPEEIVFHEKEYVGKMFFLVKGDVDICSQTKNLNNEKYTVVSTI